MTSSPNPRHLEIALHHANAIQLRKDLQARIDNALETLIDFPLTASSTPEAPAEPDLANLQVLLQLFCPSDFDSLIEERRCADRCGYVLCQRLPKKSKRPSTYRIIHSRKGEPLKAVPSSLLESWCSQDCARRAAFLKLQLIKEPAWLRKEDESPNLVILAGSGDDAVETPLSAVSTSSNQPGVVAPTVVENYPRASNAEPSSVNSLDHTAVEGYSAKNLPA